jgi:hypothetical protein
MIAAQVDDCGYRAEQLPTNIIVVEIAEERFGKKK